jgi:transcriptional regulator with XRE-family HTH domain
MAESNTITGARRTLGEQLRSLRAAAGVTQQGLAEKVGYSRSTVANVEVGRQGIDRAFWEGCDEVLNANGLLKDGFDQVEQLHRAVSREAAESAQRARLAQISEWKSGTATQNTVSTTNRQADSGPAVQIIHKAFTGVDDLENADSSAQVPDLEARVLEAFRHNEGRPTGSRPSRWSAASLAAGRASSRVS